MQSKIIIGIWAKSSGTYEREGNNVMFRDWDKWANSAVFDFKRNTYNIYKLLWFYNIKG